MKKLVAILLVMILTLSVGSALAYDKEHPITIEFWHTRGSGKNYDQLKDSVDLFNSTIGAEKGIIISETYQGSYAQSVPKLQLASQSGEQPVVFVVAGDYVSTLLDDGLLSDMMPYIEASEDFDLNNIFDSLLEMPGNEDGQIHSLPYIKSTPVFYYNKTMADAKGLTPPTTVEEMEEFCKALHEVDPATGEVKVWGFTMYNNISYVLGNFLCQLDGPFLGEGGTAPCLDGTLEKALTDWDRWVAEGWCRPFESTNPNDVTKEMFAQGRMASFVLSCASIANVEKSAKDAGFELGISNFPTYDRDNPVSIIGGGELALISGENTEEQKQAGWEFIKFLLTDDRVADNAVRTGYLPITKSVADTDEMQTFWEENPIYKVGYDQLNNAIPESYPYFEGREEFRVNCQAVISMLIQERSLTPAQAVQQIKDDNAHLFK